MRSGLGEYEETLITFLGESEEEIPGGIMAWHGGGHTAKSCCFCAYGWGERKTPTTSWLVEFCQ
jgi:hypothetical protein